MYMKTKENDSQRTYGTGNVIENKYTYSNKPVMYMKTNGIELGSSPR